MEIRKLADQWADQLVTGVAVVKVNVPPIKTHSKSHCNNNNWTFFCIKFDHLDRILTQIKHNHNISYQKGHFCTSLGSLHRLFVSIINETALLCADWFCVSLGNVWADETERSSSEVTGFITGVPVYSSQQCGNSASCLSLSWMFLNITICWLLIELLICCFKSCMSIHQEDF